MSNVTIKPLICQHFFEDFFEKIFEKFFRFFLLYNEEKHNVIPAGEGIKIPKRIQKEGKKCINTDKYTEWMHKDTNKTDTKKNTDK